MSSSSGLGGGPRKSAIASRSRSAAGGVVGAAAAAALDWVADAMTAMHFSNETMRSSRSAMVAVFFWASSRAASRSARVSSYCFFNLAMMLSLYINDFCKSRIFIVMFSPRATATSVFS